MRIGIDVRTIAGQSTGIGRYTHSLIKSLAAVDRENEYLLYGFFFKNFDKGVLNRIIPNEKNFTFAGKRIPGRILSIIWRLGYLPLEYLVGELDVLILPECVTTPWAKGKTIVVIHDVAPFFAPQWYTNSAASQITRRLKEALGKTNRIIAISNNTKKDLIKFMGLHEEIISVIHGAVDETFYKVDDGKVITDIKKRYKIDGKFILFVGTLEPRKNLNLLITAYMKLRQKNAIEHRLVIVGKKGWTYKEIFEAVERLGISGDVIFTGYVPDEELVLFYNAADLFVYPSFYEGFGLPPLEAMSCGTPVITSNTSSLPEVVGDAGIMIDPHDVEGLASAMEKVLHDEALRERMSKDGIDRAKLFSREKMAMSTLKVLEDVFKG